MKSYHKVLYFGLSEGYIFQFILLLSLFLTLQSQQIKLFAQQPTEEWVRRYSDTSINDYLGSSIKMDNSGNIYVLAKTGNFGFLKYDQSGNLLTVASNWPSGYNSGGGAYFDVNSIGDVYVTGDISIITNSPHIYTAKFNSNGNFQWGRIYNSFSGNRVLDIKIDNENNVILVGSSRDDTANYGIILKYNSNGDTLWTKHFNNFQNEALFKKIAFDNVNNIYVTGYVGLPGNCLIMKYGPQGNQDWFTQFSIQTGSSHIGQGIAIDASGNLYTILTADVSFSGLNNYLLKISNNGTIQWSRVFKGILSGEGRNTDIPKGPVISSDGSSIYFSTMSANGLGGGSYSVATIKYNSSGDSQWVKVYGGGGIPGANRVSSIKLDKFENVYICGSGRFQTTGDDAVIVKYDPIGTQQWTTLYTGLITNGGDGTNDLLIDTNLNVFSTGVSKKTDNNGIVAFTRKINQIVGINPISNQVLQNYMLYQNFPNPFNPITKIYYSIPRISKVTIVVYDILGRLVRSLVNDFKEVGNYTVSFDGSGLASGVYFFRIEAGDFVDSKKMVLVQ